MESATRHKGRVKFFNSIKGFGFILPDSTEDNNDIQEVFVHHTAIHNNGGFKSLAEGEEVEYVLAQGPKGMQASNVTGPQGVAVQGDSRPHRQYYPNQQGYDNNNNRRGPYNSGGFMMDPYASSFGYGVLPGYQYMQQQPMHYPQYPSGGGGFATGTNSVSPQLQPQHYNGSGYMMYSPPNAGMTNQPQFYENNDSISPSQQQQQTIATSSSAHPPSPSNKNDTNLSC
ncbi:cold-shock' DNA-binding domain-containing protein [Parasitella parasitica]|nr:cold-shock' DNA-binding domain-containing protein [Parasitella parasitica]